MTSIAPLNFFFSKNGTFVDVFKSRDIFLTVSLINTIFSVNNSNLIVLHVYKILYAYISYPWSDWLPNTARFLWATRYIVWYLPPTIFLWCFLHLPFQFSWPNIEIVCLCNFPYFLTDKTHLLPWMLPTALSNVNILYRHVTCSECKKFR